jgi:hypothetical protein
VSRNATARAESFRHRAAYLRRLAESTQDPAIVDALLDLAAEFERQANIDLGTEEPD